jgi:hypothetical protein
MKPSSTALNETPRLSFDCKIRLQCQSFSCSFFFLQAIMSAQGTIKTEVRVSQSGPKSRHSGVTIAVAIGRRSYFHLDDIDVPRKETTVGTHSQILTRLFKKLCDEFCQCFAFVLAQSNFLPNMSQLPRSRMHKWSLMRLFTCCYSTLFMQ